MDEEEFSDFYRKERGKLVNFLFKRTGDYQKAEDIGQIAFYKLRKHYPDKDVKDSRRLLYPIAINRSIDEYRWSLPMIEYKEEINDSPYQLELQKSLDMQIIQNELLKLVPKMPKSFRKICTIKIESPHLTNKEIAKLLNIKIGTVKSKTHRLWEYTNNNGFLKFKKPLQELVQFSAQQQQSSTLL